MDTNALIARSSEVPLVIEELQRLARVQRIRRQTFDQLSQNLCDECKATAKCSNNRRLLQYGVFLLHDRFALVSRPERKLLVALCELVVRSMRSSAMSVSFASLFLSTEFVHVASRTISALLSRIFDHIGHADLSKVVDGRAVASFIAVLDLFSGCSTDKWVLLRDNAPVASILETLCVKMSTPCATRAHILTLQKVLFAGLKGVRQPLNDQSIDELFRVIVRFMRIANFDAGEACATFVQLLKAPALTMAFSENSLQLVKELNLFADCISFLSSVKSQSELLALGTFETLHLVANLIHLGNADRETTTQKLLEWARLVNILLQKCIQKGGSHRPSNCWHHPLLGWTSERIDERDQVCFARLRAQLSRLWSCDMVRCLSDHFLSRVPISTSSLETRQKMAQKHSLFFARRHSSAAQESEHNESGTGPSSNLPLFQMFLRKLPTRPSCSTLSATTSSTNVAEGGDIVGQQQQRHKPTRHSTKNSRTANVCAVTVPLVPFPPITPTVVLCQLYRSALLAFPNSESEILASLGRDDTLLLQHLWQFLNEQPAPPPPPQQQKRREDGTAIENVRLRTYLGYLVSDPEVLAAQFAPLQLFIDITFTLISILDEREMYECERPFGRDQLRQIAKFVNLFCFHALWNELIDFEKDLPSKLFNSVYRLLQILFNRDCRRPFTGVPNFWTVDELSPKALIAEFVGGTGFLLPPLSAAVSSSPATKRAHILMDKMPHVIPLRDRIVLFRKLIRQDKESVDTSTTIITVERSRLIEDGYSQLGNLSLAAIKGTVRVKFINQQGLDEAGIDQDGVFKEFLELTLKRVFDPDLNLFKSTSDKLLYPSSTSTIHDNHLELFQFVGRMLAKAVYEGICVDVQLAPVLLAAVLGKQLHPFDELATLDPVLYKNLTFLKHYSDSDDVADLELTFCAQDEFLGRVTTVELISGGCDIKVDNENKVSYIHLMAHHRVVKQIREQTKHFVLGFRAIIQPKWLALFNTHELQHLISGKMSDLDLNDLRKHVQYYGGFHSGHRVVKWLWAILEQEFSMEERHLFLKFVTSCSRAPLLGFGYLEPCFSIRCIETSDDLDQGDTLGSVIRGFLGINKRSKQPINDRLPTASTCFNLLKLPNYTKRSVLLEKLRYAIHSETGFELS
ncbi:hypothetical protein niasHT_016680 [Heterodera trifolii]|uniref:HECT-type E3 ubiquitin transferase n=1 Tax=Heterodera trifolii TaxID=157864 RepID=A0ABD2KUN2_9BILA